MRKIDLLKNITDVAKDYREKATESLRRNSHMNNLGGECRLTQDEVDALLTDFINFVGVSQGVDYAMYSRDLKKTVKCICVLCDFESTGEIKTDPESIWMQICGKCPRCKGGDLIVNE